VKHLKATSAIGVAAAALALSGPAAAITYSSISGWAGASPTVISSPDPNVPDVIFTYLSNGDGANTYEGAELLDGLTALPDSIDVEINRSTLTGRYTFDLSEMQSTLSANTTYGIQYYIDVDGWFSPDQVLRLGEVFLGANVAGSGTAMTFQKIVKGVLWDPSDPNQDPTQPGAIGAADEWTILGPEVQPAPPGLAAFDDSLTTEGDNTVDIFCGQCTRFLVTDIITVPTGVGFDVSSVQNTYGLVPEPATLALFGSGLLAAGAATRRRNRKR
jgi:hypothetical protein